MSESSNEKVALPHHEQQELCTTRLPYRQGRKLTAVKVYTINSESNHLLIFGVPSLNLRQEVKALFTRFGKLIQFYLTTDHPAEVFTETYHAKFEKIQSARIAKRMLDTKNFYGGTLHICYAPEFETVDEAREKILKRQHDVLYRLRNLENETNVRKVEDIKIADLIDEDLAKDNKRKMNMGEENTIIVNNNKRKRKKIEPTPIVNEVDINNSNVIRNYNSFSENIPGCSSNIDLNSSNIYLNSTNNDIDTTHSVGVHKTNINNKSSEDSSVLTNTNEVIEIVDFTSTDKQVVSNINEALNYNKFGNEVIRKVPHKPMNRIKFNFNNK